MVSVVSAGCCLFPSSVIHSDALHSISIHSVLLLHQMNPIVRHFKNAPDWKIWHKHSQKDEECCKFWTRNEFTSFSIFTIFRQLKNSTGNDVPGRVFYNFLFSTPILRRAIKGNLAKSSHSIFLWLTIFFLKLQQNRCVYFSFPLLVSEEMGFCFTNPFTLENNWMCGTGSKLEK